MLPRETKSTVLPKESKINTKSKLCGGHSNITKQIKAKGSKIHTNRMSVHLPGEVAFSM